MHEVIVNYVLDLFKVVPATHYLSQMGKGSEVRKQQNYNIAMAIIGMKLIMRMTLCMLKNHQGVMD